MTCSDSNQTSLVRHPRRLALAVFLFGWLFVLLPVLIIQSDSVANEHVALVLPFALYAYFVWARRFLSTPQRPKRGFRSHLLRIVAWGAAAVCVAALVGYVLGFFWLVSWSSSDGAYHLSTHAGRVDYFSANPKWGAWRPGDRGFQSRPLTTMPSAAWWPPVSVTGSSKMMLTVRVLIWMIFVLVASLAVLAWYLDRGRRPRPGHCPCGYNLTGNLSGTCPECGQPFERTGDAP